MTEWRSRVRKAMGWALAALSIPLAIAVLLLRTPPGNDVLAWAIARASGGTVVVEHLRGDLPNQLNAASVEISDDSGVWLKIADLKLDWSAIAAIRGRYIVRRVTAATVTVLRMPQSSRSEGEGPQISIANVNVPDLNLAPAVAGRRMHFRLRGSLRYLSLHEMGAKLEIARRDSDDSYRIDGEVHDDVARGYLRLREGAGGALAALAGLPDIGPLAVDAQASGSRNSNLLAVRVAAGALQGTAGGTIELAARRLDVNVALSAPSMHPGPDIGWQSLSLDGHAKGPFDGPDLGGEFRLVSPHFSGFGAKDFSARVTGEGGHAAIRAVATGLQVPGRVPALLAHSPVAATADVNFAQDDRPIFFSVSHALFAIGGHMTGKDPAHLSGTADFPSLSPFASLAGLSLEGAFSSKIDVEIRGGQLRCALDGEIATAGASRLSRLLGPHAALSLRAVARNGEILDSKVTLRGSGVEAQVFGNLRAQRLNFAGRMNVTDMALVAPTLRGNVSLSGSLKGPLNSAAMRALGSASIASGAYEPQRVSFDLEAAGLPSISSARLRAEGKFDESQVSVVGDLVSAGTDLKASLRGRWKSLSANVGLTLPRNAPIDGSIALAVGSLSDLSSLAGAPMGGSLDANVKLQPRGRTTMAYLRAHAADLTMADMKFGAVDLDGWLSEPFGASTFDVSVSGRNARAFGLGGAVHARLAGTADRSALSIKAELADANRNPVDMSAEAAIEPGRRAATIQSLALHWRGVAATLARPATIDFADGVAIDRLSMGLGGGNATVTGRISPRLDASFAFERLELGPLASLITDADLVGTVGGAVRLGGTMAEPDASFDISARDVGFRGFNGAAAPAAIVAKGTLAGGMLKLSADLDAGRFGNLTASGSLPIAATGKVSGRISGAIDAAAIGPFVDAGARQLSGRIQSDVTIAGTFGSPRVTGTISLQNGELRDFVRGIRLHTVNAAINARGNVLRIETFSARAGPGTIEGTGTIDLSAPGLPVDIALTARNARPVASDLARVTLSGDVTLKGELQADMRLTGKLDITRADVNLPDKFPPDVAVLNVRRRGQPAPPTVRSSAIALDLTVSSSGPIMVRGHGIDAVMGGRIQLTGSTTRPSAGGGFSMERGSVSFAGQTLNFTSGRIGFDGTGVRNRFDPTLDFVAQTQSGGVTATLAIGGYASAPKFTLTSTPPLPQDEILAHLLFRQSVKQLTPLQLAQIAEAVAALGGIGTGFNPLGALRRSLGLDRLSVGSTGNGSAGGTAQTTVEAGKYVAPNVYVGTRQNLSGGTQVQVQVDITRQLKAQATVSTGSNATATSTAPGQDNGSSVGLSYEFEY